MTSSPVALVTGASRGIGRAIALQLAEEGYSLLVNYVSNQAAADEVAQAAAALGVTALPVQADVGQPQGRQTLMATAIAEFGRLDVLVNNAGVTSPGRLDLLEATEESWDLVFDTNLKGPFFLAQAAARLMIENINAGVHQRAARSSTSRRSPPTRSLRIAPITAWPRPRCPP